MGMAVRNLQIAIFRSLTFFPIIFSDNIPFRISGRYSQCPQQQCARSGIMNTVTGFIFGKPLDKFAAMREGRRTISIAVILRKYFSNPLANAADFYGSAVVAFKIGGIGIGFNSIFIAPCQCRLTSVFRQSGIRLINISRIGTGDLQQFIGVLLLKFIWYAIYCLSN